QGAGFDLDVEAAAQQVLERDHLAGAEQGDAEAQVQARRQLLADAQHAAAECARFGHAGVVEPQPRAQLPASMLPPAVSAAEAASSWRPSLLLRFDSGRPSASQDSAWESSLAGSVQIWTWGAEARPVTLMPAVMSWASILRSARMSSRGSEIGPLKLRRPRVTCRRWP